MAATRTVYRGSKGRFAGASAGQAEAVRVGRGYRQSGAARPASSQKQRPSRLTRVGKTTLKVTKKGAVSAVKSKTVRRAGVAALGAGFVGAAARSRSAKALSEVILG